MSDPTQSSYDLFLQAPFNQPNHYPLDQTVSPELYRPLSNWMGRLILPTLEQRHVVKGVWFEVHHAPDGYAHLIGQQCYLRWSDQPDVMARVWSVARDVYFSKQVEQSMHDGLIHPQRLRSWRLVTALESLAGARPNDDVIVKLPEPLDVVETSGQPASLIIRREPIQITGRYYALVTFQALTEADIFQVTHFNQASGLFDGPQELVRLPATIEDNAGLQRSGNEGIIADPLNISGWYISGAKDRNGMFVVQALGPRDLLRLEPQQVINGEKEAIQYIKKQSWHDAAAQKGTISSVLLTTQTPNSPVAAWQEGDEALLVNTYGGIGNGLEPYPYPGGYYFGHFSYGRARVVREPLANELNFDIEYYQVFSSNGDGLIPGILHWTRYVGDRQFGYLGYRPICDILIKLDSFTVPYDFEEQPISALHRLTILLETTLHTYRIGGGSGGVFFGMANNCTQDSNQALFAAIQILDTALKERPMVKEMLNRLPHEAERFNHLLSLGQQLKNTLLPFRAARGDWRYNFHLVDTSLSEGTLTTLLRGISSWNTITPHWASNAVTKVFLQHGAAVWVLRINLVGNYNPDMVPRAIDP